MFLCLSSPCLKSRLVWVPYLCVSLSLWKFPLLMVEGLFAEVSYFFCQVSACRQYHMEGYSVDSSSADHSLTLWKVLLLKDPLLTVSVAVESHSVESYCSVSHPMD